MNFSRYLTENTFLSDLDNEDRNSRGNFANKNAPIVSA